MRAVKVTAEDGTKVVGVRYPEDLLPEVRERVANEWVMRDDQENEADARERAKEGGGGMRGGGEGGNRGRGGNRDQARARGRADARGREVRGEGEARASDAPDVLREARGEGAEGVEETDAATKRARPLAEVAEAAERGGSRRRRRDRPSRGRGKTVWGKATKKSERKPTRVETATCPICGRGFSATALNSDINAHVDACMNAMANE